MPANPNARGAGGASRGLQYTAPTVPSFLQQLHSQVHGGRSDTNFRRRQEDESVFDGVEEEDETAIAITGASDKRGISGRGVGTGKSTHAGAGEHASLDDDAEDEWDGAQVVVLKQGKHLSHDEVASAKEAQQRQAAASSSHGSSAGTTGTTEAAIATAGSHSTKRKRAQLPSEASLAGPLSRAATNEDTHTTSRKTKKKAEADASTYEGLKELLAAQRTHGNKQTTGPERSPAQKAKAKVQQTKRDKKSLGKGLSFDVEE
ncbi:unnamed protein product [Parajaminaea phylloscopi]